MASGEILMFFYLTSICHKTVEFIKKHKGWKGGDSIGLRKVHIPKITITTEYGTKNQFIKEQENLL